MTEYFLKILLSVTMSTMVFLPQPVEAFLDQILSQLRSSTSSSKSYGVIIGINHYENMKDLNYASNDARSMTKVLRAMGFIIEKDAILIRSNPREPQVTKTLILKTVYKILKKTEQNDRVVIFYAGHGQEVDFQSHETEAYLLPSDFDPSDEMNSGLSFGDLVKFSDHSIVNAKHILFLLDACFAARALKISSARGSHPEDPLDLKFFEEIAGKPFLGVITAGGEGQLVKEEAGNGVFTRNLIKALMGYADMDGNGLIPFDELVTWIKKPVFDESGDYKQLVTAGDLKSNNGQIIFQVPPDSQKKNILGEIKGEDLAFRHRIKQNSLISSSSRGGNDVPGVEDSKIKFPEEKHPFLIALVDAIYQIAGLKKVKVESVIRTKNLMVENEVLREEINESFGHNIHIQGSKIVNDLSLENYMINLTYWENIFNIDELARLRPFPTKLDGPIPVTIKLNMFQLSSISGPFLLSSFLKNLEDSGFKIQDVELTADRIRLPVSYWNEQLNDNIDVVGVASLPSNIHFSN